MNYEDRLRVTAHLAGVGAEADAALAAKDAEIARLREALAAIVNRCDGSAVRIARAALANGGGE